MSDSLQQAIWALSDDMHTASPRPCATCRRMTEALGLSFGCEKLDRERKRRRAGR